MTAPRLQEVVARVVAWHNRHPLARRIDASQVHSIGEVVLPFVSRQAVHGATPAPQPAPAAAPPDDDGMPPGMSSLGAALAQRSARLHPPAAAQPDPQVTEGGLANLAGADLAPAQDSAPPADGPLQDVASPGTAWDADAPAADAPAIDDDGEAALVIPLLDGDTGHDDPMDADAPQAAATEQPPDSAPPGDASPDNDTGATPDLADGPAAAADADIAPHPADEQLPGGLADDGLDPLSNRTTDTHPDNVHPADVYPPPHGAVPASALARAVERRAAARAPQAGTADATEADPASAAGGSQDGPGDPGAAATHQPASAPSAPPAAHLPAPPASRWQRLLAALRRLLTGRQAGMPPLRAAFSQDFAWPLKPSRIARWAQRHGQLQPLAPADWPRRSIDLDRPRTAALRQAGHAHDLPLHVLTAAIGVGDRRIRLLVGTDGSVLGPRAWDRSRAGTATILLAVGLVALGWHLRPLHGPQPGDTAAVLAALPASAAAPASATVAAAAADLPASAASEASDDAHAHAAQAASAPADAASAAEAATAVAAAGSASAAGPDAAGSAPQADIRPVLSPEEKYAARVEAARLRGEPPPPPPNLAEAGGPVYALVGPSSARREHAAGGLALMKAAASRMDGAAPAHGELVQSQGQWRAAWWPFASLVDAERARVLLAGRGLKAEVVEF